jgi:hypothetical protein
MEKASRISRPYYKPYALGTVILTSDAALALISP